MNRVAAWRVVGSRRALPAPSRVARRWCSGEGDGSEETEAQPPVELVKLDQIPSVLLVVGDAFVEDNFSTITTDPAWLGDEALRHAENFFWEKGPNHYENLAGWKPLSATTHYLCKTYNLKAIAWSRHPLNTSRMVYTLINDHAKQDHPATIIPHYHIDRLRESWSKGNTPFYFMDTQGHSATFRSGLDRVGQPVEYKTEYKTPPVPQPAPAESYLPEVFAVIVGVEEDWGNIKSNPPSVLEPIIDEAKALKSAGLQGALPATKILNLLVDKYGCKIRAQMVTNNNLKAITFTLENPHALAALPRVPADRQAKAAAA